MSDQFDAVCVIPARLGSTRLPRKLLRTIAGKPILQWVYEHAKQARLVSRVIVACDDESLISCVRNFGGEALMTRPDHQSGTERIAEVAAGLSCEAIVNLQADEPLMPGEVVDQVVRALREDPACQMSTACVKKDDPNEFRNPNVVKLTKDVTGRALYFSRSPIPHDRDGKRSDFLKHLGIYGYRRDFLLKFSSLAGSDLENRERLEQLKALENGICIKVVETTHDSVGIDTAEDLERVETFMTKRAGAHNA